MSFMVQSPVNGPNSILTCTIPYTEVSFPHWSLQEKTDFMLMSKDHRQDINTHTILGMRWGINS